VLSREEQHRILLLPQPLLLHILALPVLPDILAHPVLLVPPVPQVLQVMAMLDLLVLKVPPGLLGLLGVRVTAPQVLLVLLVLVEAAIQVLLDQKVQPVQLVQPAMAMLGRSVQLGPPGTDTLVL